MSRLPRALASALAILALAAPAAVAQQRIDPPTAAHKTASQWTHHPGDLRSGGDLRTSSLAGTTETSLGDSGPVYWSYDHPAPIPASQPAAVDDGTPWLIMGLGLAAACCIAAAMAALAARTRVRSRSERVAA
jgi:hypothetical protein